MKLNLSWNINILIMPLFFHLGGSWVSKTSVEHEELGLCVFSSVWILPHIYILLIGSQMITTVSWFSVSSVQFQFSLVLYGFDNVAAYSNIVNSIINLLCYIICYNYINVFHWLLPNLDMSNFTKYLNASKYFFT